MAQQKPKKVAIRRRRERKTLKAALFIFSPHSIIRL